MQLIKPSAELWQPTDDWHENVVRAARLCYASEDGKKTAEEFCDMLVKRGHLSMFRHASRYFVVFMSNENPTLPYWIWVALTNSPYCSCVHRKEKHEGRTYFVSTNQQYIMEHKNIYSLLKDYEVDLSAYVAKASELNFPTALSTIRYTVCVTTQISTSRELNRTSPNNIAEQSTRYVNFGRRGGITICLPHWYDCAHWSKRIFARVSWKLGEWAYHIALRLGLPPQDARGFLPLDTATRVAYTYTAFEWRHIMQLRLTGTTGKPHPNARIAAQAIHDAILPLMRIYGGPKAVLAK